MYYYKKECIKCDTYTNTLLIFKLKTGSIVVIIVRIFRIILLVLNLNVSRDMYVKDVLVVHQPT